MDVQETEDFELDEDDESFLLQHRALEESTLNYEELVNPSRNSITCPTCSGLGRLPKTSTNELVALVPYNDERLKPRRTKCLLFGGMVIATFIFSFLTFALIPRSVTFEEAPDSPNTTKVLVDQAGASVNLGLSLRYWAYNYNYYPVQLNSLDIKVMYENYIVRNVTLEPQMLSLSDHAPTRDYFYHDKGLGHEKDETSTDQQVSVDLFPRQRESFKLEIEDVVFSKENHLDIIVDHCLWPWRKFNKIPLQFQSTLNISYWYGHSELIQEMTYHFIDCSPSSSS